MISMHSNKYATEKLATLATQDTKRRQSKQKNHRPVCVGHHYAQTNTNNVNKILALLQTTEYTSMH
jgi:spore maturation protein CgeB